MNTNNRQQNNNNRRRGRNNANNRQQSNNRSGFDYQNQIDNRARGNAAQMLEKYKKLAQDAQFNGDRVNAEYHLQFADHYFRVLADFRSRQEARQDQQGERRPREEWRDEARDDSRENSFADTGNTEVIDGYDNDSDESRKDGDDEPRRDARDNRPRRYERNDRGAGRDDRDSSRRTRRHPGEQVSEDREAAFDLSVLPPSIAIMSNGEDHDGPVEKPARKPRTRKPKSANDDETVTAAE